MLLIGMFSLLREIRVQPVRQDLPVQQDRQALLVRMARMVQTVQQRALERLLLLPDLSVLLLPAQIRLRYLRFLSLLVIQDQPDLLAEQDQRGPQVQQVLTVQMVQRQASALRPLQQDLLA